MGGLKRKSIELIALARGAAKPAERTIALSVCICFTPARMLKTPSVVWRPAICI